MDSKLTSRNSVHLVLDEEVDQRNKCPKEGTSQVFPQRDGAWVGRAEGDAAGRPRQGCDNVGDHENVVPVVIVSRGDVGPSSASQGAKDAHEGNETGELVAGLPSKKIPQTNKHKPGPCSLSAASIPHLLSRTCHTGCNGDKDHEEGPFGVSIANGGGHGGEPFIGVAVVLVLDDLVVVERDTDNEGTDECRYASESVH